MSYKPMPIYEVRELQVGDRVHVRLWTGTTWEEQDVYVTRVLDSLDEEGVLDDRTLQFGEYPSDYKVKFFIVVPVFTFNNANNSYHLHYENHHVSYQDGVYFYYPEEGTPTDHSEVPVGP